MNRTRRTAEEISHLCDELRRSGETHREFAARHGVHVATVRYWLGRQRRRAIESVPRFVEVQATSLPASQESFLVELPRGVRLHLAQQPDPGYLASIIRALQGI